MAMYEPVTVANNHNQWNGLHANLSLLRARLPSSIQDKLCLVGLEY